MGTGVVWVFVVSSDSGGFAQGGDEAIGIEYGLVLEHEVDGPGQLDGDDGPALRDRGHERERR